MYTNFYCTKTSKYKNNIELNVPTPWEEKHVCFTVHKLQKLNVFTKIPRLCNSQRDRLTCIERDRNIYRQTDIVTYGQTEL